MRAKPTILLLFFAFALLLTPFVAATKISYAASTRPAQFAYVATDGSLHLRDGAGNDLPLSAPHVFSTTLLVDEYQSAYADYAAFSPNGRYLAYVPQQGGQLTVVDVNQSIASGYANATHYTLANVVAPATYSPVGSYSPDSRYLAVETATSSQRDEKGNLNQDGFAIIDLNTASLKRAVQHASGPFAWSNDGKLAYASGANVRIADSRTGFKDTLITVAGNHRVTNIVWSANNRNVAITTERADEYILDLFLGRVGVANALLLDSDADLPQWTADGRVLFYRQVKAYGGSANSYNIYARPLGGIRHSLGVVLNSYSSFTLAPFSYRGNYIFNNLLVSASGKVVGKLWDYQGEVYGWSPQGSATPQVAIRADYYAGDDGSGDTRTLQWVHLPASQPKNLYTAQGWVDFGPSIKMTALWSPGGKYLAFYAMGGGNAMSGPPTHASVIGIAPTNGSQPDTAQFDYAIPHAWLNDQTAIFQNLNVDQREAHQAIYSLVHGGQPTKLVDGVWLAMRPGK